jgi:DNA-binding NtrC family response regulator
VAVTNRPVEALNDDLLARFGVRVHVPGFEERPEDVPLLARTLLGRMALQAPMVRVRFFEGGEPRVDPVLLERLLRHRYTHHTRELAQLLRVAIASSPGEFIAATPEFLAELEAVEAPEAPSADDEITERDSVPSLSEIQYALNTAGGNVTRAAAELGLSRDSLRRLLRRQALNES